MGFKLFGSTRYTEVARGGRKKRWPLSRSFISLSLFVPLQFFNSFLPAFLSFLLFSLCSCTFIISFLALFFNGRPSPSTPAAISGINEGEAPSTADADRPSFSHHVLQLTPPPKKKPRSNRLSPAKIGKARQSPVQPNQTSSHPFCERKTR